MRATSGGVSGLWEQFNPAPAQPWSPSAQYWDGKLRVKWSRVGGTDVNTSYDVQCTAGSTTPYDWTDCHTAAPNLTDSYFDVWPTFSGTATKVRVRARLGRVVSDWVTVSLPLTLAASSISGTGATLAIIGHSGTWYYQGISGTSASTNCVTVSNSSTHTLSNLTAGNFYGYTAYSGANCTTELASEYFAATDYNVGNLGVATSGGRCSIGSASGIWKCAAAFSTGNQSGYTLKSVTGRFYDKSGDPSGIIVKIHAADTTNSSSPGAEVATLSGLDPDTEGLYTYTCSGNGCALSANTTYFVVMSTADTVGDKSYNVDFTLAHAEAKHPNGNGWAIADVARYQYNNGAWTDFPGEATLMLHVAAND